MKDSTNIYSQWEKLETNLDEAIQICDDLFKKSNFKGSEEFNEAHKKLMAAQKDFLEFESKNKHIIFAKKE